MRIHILEKYHASMGISQPYFSHITWSYFLHVEKEQGSFFGRVVNVFLHEPFLCQYVQRKFLINFSVIYYLPQTQNEEVLTGALRSVFLSGSGLVPVCKNVCRPSKDPERLAVSRLPARFLLLANDNPALRVPGKSRCKLNLQPQDCIYNFYLFLFPEQ